MLSQPSATSLWAEQDSGTVFLELAYWTPDSAPKTSQGQSCHPSSQRFSPESQSWMAGPSLKQELRFESLLVWRDLRRVFTLPIGLGL